MTLPSFLSWNWSLAPFIGAIVLIAGYAWISRYHSNIYKTLSFMGGLIVAELALAIPLGPAPAGFIANALSCCLPGGTLLSLHMIRHMLLLLVAPPLLVAGLPDEPVRKFLSRPNIKPWIKRFSSPKITLIVGVGTMWFWHVPYIYNYVATYGTGFGHFIVPRVEIISLIIAGAMLSWPLLSPIEEYRIHPLKGILYLFFSCIGCSILGMLIAFSSTGYYYTAFANQPGPIWGLTQKSDQMAAGLIMWVPGCFFYVASAMALFAQWAYQMTHPSYNKKPAYSTKKAYDGKGQKKEDNEHQPSSTPHISQTPETANV